MSREAVDRFLKSMVMDFDKWHDGIGYDVEALNDMDPDELASIAMTLRDRDQTWREIEALAMINLPEAQQSVVDSSKDHLNNHNRVVASEQLVRQGKMTAAEFEDKLCLEIRRMSSQDAGMTRILLEAEALNTEKIRQALLWASWNSTDCAFFAAGRLLYLTGNSPDQLSMNHRPLLFKLQPNNSYFDRKAAFDELCKLCKMELDTDVPY